MTDTMWLFNAPNDNYNDSNNWDLGTPNESDTGLFGKSSITDITVTVSTDVGAWIFDPRSSDYTIELQIYSGITFSFTGSGITVNGGSCFLWMHPNTTVEFLNNASAGKASIGVDGNGRDPTTLFLYFLNRSTAGRADISCTLASNVLFYQNSSAGHSTIYGGNVQFDDDSSARRAVIQINDGSVTFLGQSNGGSARFEFLDAGFIDFSATTGPHGDGHVTAGSIETAPGFVTGPGTLVLGSNQLTVGSNNRSTEFAGLITDGRGTGGSLVKVGHGTWKLSGAFNTYSGGTGLDAGTLELAAVEAAGIGAITFAPGSHAKLRIDNASLSAHVFGNEIDFFGKHDVLDLTGLHFHAGATAKYHPATEVLAVHSGHATDKLTLVSPHGIHFEAASDHHGGTDVFLVFA